MSMSTATTPERKSTTLSAIPSKRFGEMSTKSILGMISKDADSLIPLTFYNQVFAYVVPAAKATAMLKSKDDMVSFLTDLKSIAPYVQAALNAGLPFGYILDEVLKDDEGGVVAVDFPALARLLSRSPITVEADGDGSPIITANFEGATYEVDSEDEDDEAFARL